MTNNRSWGAVIPCKNEVNRVHIIISSLKNQSPSPKIIVVVDDGSNDQTAKKARMYEPVKVITLPDRGYSALGKVEMAETFNAGFKELEKYDLDYILVAGADNEFYNSYIMSLILTFELETSLAMTSGNPEGEPIVRSHVSGGGRLIKTEFFRKIGFQYPVIHGWETAVIFEAWRLGYTAHSIPVIFPITRKSGTHIRDYAGWGKGMKALGYWFPFTYRRIVGWFLRGRFKESFQLLKGYYSKDIIHASPELKLFVKNYQKERLKSKFRRKQKVVKLEPCAKFPIE